MPLVRVTHSFLCGLATSLPSGIDMLLGNDLCPSAPAVDVAVVTRSQTAALRREADLQTPLVSDPEDYSAEAESDSVVSHQKLTLHPCLKVLSLRTPFRLNLSVAAPAFLPWGGQWGAS